MNSSHVAFDKLLSPLPYGGKRARLIDAYRELISNQDTQDEILASFDMQSRLLPFEQNSFTEFSQSIYFSPIEKLSGTLASKVDHLAAPLPPQTDSDSVSHRQLKRPRKSNDNSRKQEAKSQPVSSKVKNRGDKLKVTSSSFEKGLNNQLRHTEVQHVANKKTAKLRLSSDLTIHSTTNKASYPLIDSFAASEELNNRMHASGLQGEWATRKIGSRKPTNIDIQAQSPCSLASVSKVDISSAKAEALHQDIGADLIKKADKNVLDSSEYKVDNKASRLNESVSGEWLKAHFKKGHSLASQSESEKQKTQQGIDKKLLGQLDKIDKASDSLSEPKDTVQSPRASSNAINKIPNSSQALTAASPIRQTETTHAHVGGLRGLAALGNQETDPQGRRVQNSNTVKQANTNTVNLVQKEIGKSDAERHDNLASDLAKSLAEEARRAGIDLEKFQP